MFLVYHADIPWPFVLSIKELVRINQQEEEMFYWEDKMIQWWDNL